MGAALARRLTAAALCMLAAAAQAQGILNAASVNRSDADRLDEDTGLWTSAFEARSSTELGAPVALPSGWRFEHRFAFAAGFAFEQNLTDAVLPVGGAHDLGYDLSFTVTDPARVGYTLTVDMLLAGVMRANSPASTQLPAFGIAVDYGLGFVDLAGLTTDAVDLQGGRELVREAGRLELGAFFGTRSFDVRVRTPGGDAGASGLLTGDPHRAYAQFGLATTSALLPGGGYPAFDGSRPGDHGHFLTVQAVFNTSPVPEPGRWALLASGCGLMGWLRCRRRGAR